ncbi:MAG: ABC transporter substrate-binding protein [Bacteroidia bacterium]|nr:ABC transporter substrate-binding protein [Bacteroidia bacterium]
MFVRFLLPLSLFCCLVLVSCGDSKQNSEDPFYTDQTQPEVNDWLVVHQLEEPDMLLPTHYSTVSADMLCTGNIFQSLLQYDPQTLQPSPVLAEGRPQVSEDGKSFIFTIRQNASWDNGTPVTAADVISTLKIIRTPPVNSRLSLYIDFIEDAVADPANPKKLTITTTTAGVNHEMSIGDLPVLPKYHYDPKGVLDAYTLPQLKKEAAALTDNPQLQAFAKEYLDDKHLREKGQVVGSGPYALAEWTTGQQVVLERKKDWWGDRESGDAFQAWPQKLVFRIINDMNTAILELKAQRLDLCYAIRPNVFQELEKNPDVTRNFQLMRSDMFSYSFVGMNMKPGKKRKPLFTDVRVRKAMQLLLDVNKAIEQFVFGYARRISGPVPYLKRDEYNESLKPVDLNVEEARKLLAEAGWKDSNGDGTLDKMVDGKKVEFEVEFAFGQNVEVRKNIGLMFAEDARKAGVKINVTGYENAVLREKMAGHDFDMMYYSLAAGPGPSDLKEQFHTDAWLNGGFNFMGFGTTETDRMLDAIAAETNPGKRAEMVKGFQEVIYQEAPCIFLLSSQNLFAVSKRVKGVQTTILRPNFLMSRMWIPHNLSRYAEK